MKIVVLVYGPDFACSENLTTAFMRWGDVQLVCIAASDWRHYNEGILANTPETIKQSRQVMNESDMIVLGDAMAAYALPVVCPVTNWIHWASKKTIMAYFGDSAYHKHPRFFDGLVTEIRARLFLLPNLMPLSEIEAIPLHHPQPVGYTPKADRLTIMHAPGRDGKAAVKGTENIELAIDRLKEDFDFDYRRLTSLTIADCLSIKSTAHIVIDQMPPDGYIHGLGRTGTEALACGSMVMSRMYEADNLRGYFEAPPVVDIQDGDGLYATLREYLQFPKAIVRQASKSLAWANEHIEFDHWLTYVGKYL